MKKLMTIFLALLLMFNTVLGTVAQAQIVNDDQEVIEDGDIEIDVNDLEVYKRQVQAIRDDAKDITAYNDTQREMIKNFNEKTDELELNIENSCAPEAVTGMGFSQIYDLSSIPQRLMLVGRLCVAMRFATTTLRYKVDQAHVEIAEYVFQGLVIAVSPFHTVDDMKAYMEEFEALKAKLIGYPDLTNNDTANLYVRSDLDHKLVKARALYRTDLKEAPKYVLDDLNKVIREVTSIRLRPQATVREIYEASDMLDAAVGKAIAQLQNDHRITSTEKKDLREHRNLARKARRHGDKRKELGDAIDAASKLLVQSRASSRQVQEMIDTIRMLLDMGPRN
ncbi:CAMP factor family pore-forming toxin [uncultured Fenollaria sp.]|uniref:CAMP factor family pore-forming toxin n=1 Tax=uncultured Fenollaria sp. TaxID=1686315 RepID=UPI0025F0EC97|nr:CAMP factor family pore-forming toxin [uncultured Fenollaria sp.]